MRVLVACEFSGIVRDAFRERGHDAYSCDYLPSERGAKKHHFEGDVVCTLRWEPEWDLIVAHPPCQYLHEDDRHTMECQHNVKEESVNDDDDTEEEYWQVKYDEFTAISIEAP